MIRLFLLGLLGASLLTSPASAQETWVGKTVLVKRSGLKIGHTGKDGVFVTTAVLDLADYRVTGDQGEWVSVKSRHGIEDWLEKKEVVPLDQAIAYFTERTRLEPREGNNYNRRAIAHMLLGDVPAAIQDYGEALSRSPSAPIYNNRGRAYYLSQRYDESIADYAEALRLDAKYPVAYVNRGQAWHAKKQYDKAAEDFSKAIELDPRYVSAHSNRGLAYRFLKEYDKAVADYTEAIRLDPKSAVLFTNRGMVWRFKKEPEKALADFNEAVRFDAKYASAWHFRANTRRDLKDFTAATNDYEQALRLAPKAALILNDFAWLLATCGSDAHRDGARAEKLAQQALKAEPKNANYMTTLAAAYAEIGNFDQAIVWQERVLTTPSFQNDPASKRRLELYRKQMPYHMPK